MARLRGRDVARLEGDVVAQVWRNPRDEDLPEGKRLVAVDHGTVSVGMIYDGQRFTRPSHQTSPVVVVKEAIQNSAVAPFTIPPPLPPPKPSATDSPQSNSIVVNVHGNGEAEARQTSSHPHQDRALSGSPIPSGYKVGEPAASATAAPHHSPPNVAATSLPGEFNPNSHENIVNSGQLPQGSVSSEGDIQHPVIQINTSIDEAKRSAAQYIEDQARGLLGSIRQDREIVREAIAQTVIQAEATLAKCTDNGQIKLVVEAAALAMRDYVEESNSGRYGNG